MPAIKTKEDALNALRTVVSGNEEVVYATNGRRCQYVDVTFRASGETIYESSCLVGKVLIDAWGMDPEFLHANEGSAGELFGFMWGGDYNLDSASPPNRVAVREVIDIDDSAIAEYVEVDEGAFRLLSFAQAAQDDSNSEMTWGEVLVLVEAVAELLP